MRLVGDFGGLRRAEGDADRRHPPGGAQAPRDFDRNARRRSRCDGRAGRNRRGARTAGPGRRLRRPPAARGSPSARDGSDRRSAIGGTSAARSRDDGDRQRGAKAVRRKRDEQRQRVGFVADRQKRRNDVGLDAPREGDALFGEARRERYRGSSGSTAPRRAKASFRKTVLREAATIVISRSIRSESAGPRWPLDGDPGRLRE